MVCPECKKKIPDNSTVCKKCGAEIKSSYEYIGAADMQPRENKEWETEKPKKKIRWGIPVTVIVAIVMFFGGIAVSGYIFSGGGNIVKSISVRGKGKIEEETTQVMPQAADENLTETAPENSDGEGSSEPESQVNGDSDNGSEGNSGNVEPEVQPSPMPPLPAPDSTPVILEANSDMLYKLEKGKYENIVVVTENYLDDICTENFYNSYVEDYGDAMICFKTDSEHFGSHPKISIEKSGFDPLWKFPDGYIRYNAKNIDKYFKEKYNIVPDKNYQTDECYYYGNYVYVTLKGKFTGFVFTGRPQIGIMLGGTRTSVESYERLNDGSYDVILFTIQQGVQNPRSWHTKVNAILIREKGKIYWQINSWESDDPNQ